MTSTNTKEDCTRNVGVCPEWDPVENDVQAVRKKIDTTPRATFCFMELAISGKPICHPQRSGDPFSSTDETWRREDYSLAETAPENVTPAKITPAEEQSV
jgi:hypothetical protein